MEKGVKTEEKEMKLAYKGQNGNSNKQRRKKKGSKNESVSETLNVCWLKRV